MASTYTTFLGIEKPATGEQSGTWGDTVNTNMDMLDQAIDGIISITLSATGSTGSPNTIPITDGAVSNGRNKFIEFVDSGDIGGTVYVQLTPNDAEKTVRIRNSLSGSRSILLFQGTYDAANDFEVLAGRDYYLKFNGAGSGATVTDINANLTVTILNATTLTASGVITGGTVEATTDTAASDNAAMGYTSAEGLILTGQGSSTDVTIKNDADATVISIPTGTTNVDIVGVTTAATFEPDGDTAASDNAAIGYTAAEGIIVTGQGSTSDVTLKNDADGTVLTIPTGTTNVDVVGDFTAGTLNADADTAASDNAAIGYTAAEGIIITGQGSTNDVTIKNDADADVIEIPTGTTNVTVAGNLGVGGTVTGTGTSVFADLDISGSVDIDGTTNLDAVDIDGAVQLDSTFTVGVDDTGYDVKFFGATTGKSLLWDEDADSLIVTGTTTLVGTTNLDAVDIDGAVQVDGTVSVGVDDTGYDVKFFGDTSGKYMLWDTSADALLVSGAAVKVAGLETIYVPAAAMYPNTTAGCSALTQVELSNGPELKCLDFATGSDENAQFTVCFPKSWNEGTVTFQAFWTVTGTNTGTVAWGLSGGSMADDASINTAFGTNVVATAKAFSGTSNDMTVSAVSGAVTIANAAVDTMTYFQVMRDVSADDQSGDARLLGIKLFFTTDAANDA